MIKQTKTVVEETNVDKTSKKDAVFKSIYGGKDGIYFLEDLLSVVLDKKVKIRGYKDKELPIVRFNEKFKKIDMLVEIENEIVHIELNTGFSDYIRFRNYVYLSKIIVDDQLEGKKYKYNQKYLTINLSYGLAKKKKLLDLYKIQNDENEEYIDNVKIIVANMDKAKELCYNGDNRAVVRHLAALSMTRSELEEYKEDDEFMGKLAKKLEELDADDVWFSTPEEDYQAFLKAEREEGIAEGIEQGTQQTKRETAINFMKKDIDLETISECTGLSINELEKLQEEIK